MAKHSEYLDTQTLEMVAIALSEEYGIKVLCSGRTAESTFAPGTGKPLIIIPSVSVSDKNYLILLRGYIDHEVGHVRFTDRAALDAALMDHPKIIGSLKSVTYIFEDLYVERMMGEHFFGCRGNLKKLALLVYGKKRRDPVPARELLAGLESGATGQQEYPYHLWTAISQYILYRTRGEALVELREFLPFYREPVDLFAPGLADRLEPVLARVRAEGVSSRANFELARETMAVVEDYFQGQRQWPGEAGGGGSIRIPEMVMRQLGWVLRNGGSAKEAVDIGKSASMMVDDILNALDQGSLERTIVIHHDYGAEVWKKRMAPLSDQEQIEALQASAMMNAQLHSLLQSYTLNRMGPFRQGSINTNFLYKIFTCDPNIFFKSADKRDLKTEIVLAMDMSGSMNFNDKYIMASKALYAVAYSLNQIRGIRLAITGFFDNNVLEILRPDGRVTPRMKITPDGGTLCGIALNAATQKFTSSSGRKIVMMLTDGDANDPDEFSEAIRRAKKNRLEIFGIGILDPHISRYLPEHECCVIDDMRQLTPEIFRMLRKALNINF